ncbi:hypothetical protein CCR75_008864 [Bremia lactucae]|uniref:Uncharacterized protein n=1 Tax=Bremia lactucae TaxID=4779 RepID=A0A976FED4_BRELC|nr:hypothetical protein CCR75_008864 [Bremia lactucae]
MHVGDSVPMPMVRPLTPGRATLQLDFCKAYDIVSRDFLFEVVRYFGLEVYSLPRHGISTFTLQQNFCHRDCNRPNSSAYGHLPGLPLSFANIFYLYIGNSRDRAIAKQTKNKA